MNSKEIGGFRLYFLTMKCRSRDSDVFLKQLKMGSEPERRIRRRKKGMK